MAKKTQKKTAKTVPNTKTMDNVKRYLEFLTDLWNLSKKGGSFVFTPLIKMHKVSPKVKNAILAGDWVIKLDATKYRWTANKPNAETVRNVLDCFDIDKKHNTVSDPAFNKIMGNLGDSLDELTKDLNKSTESVADDVRLDELVEALNGSLNETLEPLYAKAAEPEQVLTETGLMNNLFDDYHRLQAEYLVLQDKLNNPSERIDELVAHHNRFSSPESQLVLLSVPMFEELNYQLITAQRYTSDLGLIIESNNAENKRVEAGLESQIKALEYSMSMMHKNLDVAEETNNKLNHKLASLNAGIEKIKNLSLIKLKTFFSPSWFDKFFK